MLEPTPDLLTDILGSILQDTAFIFAEPSDEPEGWTPPVLVARIAFESTRGGTLRLATSMPAAVEIAANMLGLDMADAEAEEYGRAAVSELLNVIGGSFLTRYFGTEVPSQLGLPSTDLTDEPLPGPRTCAATVRLESGEPLHLVLDLEARE
ncbi:MAG: chemotaxis protein CheX [Anaeromyxobacter sp.]